MTLPAQDQLDRIERKLFFANILLTFGKLHPDQITTASIDAYQKKRLAEIKSKAAKGGKRLVNLELNYLSGLISWAQERKLCENLLPKYKPLRYRRPLPSVLGKDDITSIIDALPPFWRAFFLCLYHAGMRFNEARTLRWDAIDHIGKVVNVKGKGGDECFIFL